MPHNFESRCQSIMHNATRLASDAQFLGLGDKFLLSDCDLLTAKKNLTEALQSVDEVLALRPVAIETQRNIDEQLDRLCSASGGAS